VDVGAASLTIEITGPEDRVNSLIDLLRPFGIEEMARTGRVAMARGGNGNGNTSSSS
jgi:acetolactate synthase-1/3 small subunit